MKSRLVPPPLPPTPPPLPSAAHADHDADSTSVLPVLDPPALPGDDSLARTDTWILPPEARAALAEVAAADQVRELESNLQSLSEQLTEARQLLAGKGQRVSQLEQAHAVAEQRAAALSAELAQLQLAAEQRAAQLQELTQARSSAEQRSAAAVASQPLREAPLPPVAADGAARAPRRDARSPPADHVPHGQHAAPRAHDPASPDHDLTAPGHDPAPPQPAAHADLAQEAALAQHEALAEARTRAEAATLRQELREVSARAAAYLESLQGLESRRLIAEALAMDLHHAAQARDSDLTRLTRELATRDDEIRARDRELAQRAERLARLEQQLGSLAETLAQRDTQLQEGRREAQGLHASITRLQGEIGAASASSTRLQGEIAAANARVHELETLLQQQAAAAAARRDGQAQDAAELQRLREAQAAPAAAEPEERVTQLESALAAERRRCGELQSELTTLRGEMEDWGEVLHAVQEERGVHLASIAAAEERMRQLEHDAAEQREATRTLRSEYDTLAARAREIEGDLRGAEQTVSGLEAEARTRSVRIEELEKSNQYWRATVEERRQAVTDVAGASPALHEAARQLSDGSDAHVEPAPGGAVRLLIQSEQGRELVHVLGRKTSIGRTPDNDLRIDAKYVSRRHAVILVGPVNAIIEDLNSTNGVLVNGRRITRHTLTDGDQISIGRTLYRFSVHRASDQR